MSIVTVVMNRQAHLWATAPEISRWSGHGEHLIVDWSSLEPIARGRLPSDPRIRVVRVEGESRWQLTRAYNFAITMAKHDLILKLDTDCWMDCHSPELSLRPNTYLRSSAAGGLNGLFMIHRSDFLQAGGFNEYLIGYGFDDKDLYQRLDRTLHCKYFPANLFRTLEHSDGERVAAADSGSTSQGKQRNTWPELQSIATMEKSKVMNRWLAEKLAWTQESGRTHYIEQAESSWIAVEESIPKPPALLQTQANAIGTRTYLSLLLGLPERYLESEIPLHDLERIQRWHHVLKTYASLRSMALISLLKLALRIGRGWRRLVGG